MFQFKVLRVSLPRALWLNSHQYHSRKFTNEIVEWFRTCLLASDMSCFIIHLSAEHEFPFGRHLCKKMFYHLNETTSSDSICNFLISIIHDHNVFRSYSFPWCHLSFQFSPCLPWFPVAVSAADSAGTETDRSRRLGLVSGDARKTLHRKLKKFWKNHDKS